MAIRIPFFRIFYSTTYTTLYAIELGLLAITPASLIDAAVGSSAYQYVFMIGGIYVLTAAIAVFIYSGRIYTHRSVLAGVGKSYVPIEEGELGRKVRKMIVKQLERSAIVAWESKPRDVEDELLAAECRGTLPPETASIGSYGNKVGRILAVDPAHPPWGYIQQAGWSSPSHRDNNKNPNVQFAEVIAELPNLVEARAVSLAPPDPTRTPRDDQPMADPTVVGFLTRPEKMGMRDYLTQLSFLGLVNPLTTGQTFLRHYERARFRGLPITEDEFDALMQTFAELLSGMTDLQPAIIEQIRIQAAERQRELEVSRTVPSEISSAFHEATSSPASQSSPVSDLLSPVTARENISRNVTPYLQQQQQPSIESFSSVIHRTPTETSLRGENTVLDSSSLDSTSLASFPSDASSVLRHSREEENG